MLIHRAASELGHKRRLAPPGSARDKDYPALAPQRPFEIALQSRQLPLAGDKNWPCKAIAFGFFCKKGRDRGDDLRLGNEYWGI